RSSCARRSVSRATTRRRQSPRAGSRSEERPRARQRCARVRGRRADRGLSRGGSQGRRFVAGDVERQLRRIVRQTAEEIGRGSSGRGDSPVIAARARCFFLVVSIFLAVPVQAAIHYTVSVAHPEQHLFHVTMEIPDVSGEVVVQMPAWNALY